jgi:hypothetical protein
MKDLMTYNPVTLDKPKQQLYSGGFRPGHGIPNNVSLWDALSPELFAG